MSRKKKQVSNIDDRSRYFKAIIYPDNPVHADLFDKIVHNLPLFDSETKWDYIGIKHNGYEDSKVHYHIYFVFVHPMWTKSLCKRFGYFDDAGNLDDQFLRVIDGKFDDALVYLTHLNASEKEQYSSSDLFGSPELVKAYLRAELRYLSKKVDKRDAFKQVSDWIASQQGIISAKMMVDFLISHECFTIRHESWLRSLWYEHNSRLAYFARKEVCDAIARDADKWADILQGGNLEIKPDEWFEIGGGNMF